MVDGTGTVYSTYHWQAAAAPRCSFPHNHSHVFAERVLPDGWNATLHEFAVERSMTHVAFALDGVVVLNATKDDPQPRRPVFWNVPWYLILNTVLGGGWPGDVGPETALPIRHEIDYVRLARPLW